jgi:3-methyladenine DNA glycosylase AlkC
MTFLLNLANDEDEKVRRFASEGCRPRLPWAMALPDFKKDPSPILPILEKLKDDDAEFVQKSVANNLNDISKDHPDLVLDICEGWKGSSKGADWIVKRACRTMLKAGNKRAMLLFGFGDPKSLHIENFKLAKKTAKIGDKVEFSFELNVKTRKKSKVRLEYVVHFAKAGGKTSKKVFQLIEKTHAPGKHELKRNHSFADMSTRKHYPGKHRISIIVNGVEKADAELTLKAK